MTDFWTSTQHVALQLALLAFAAVLAALKVISGGEALAFAGPLVGVGVGGAVSSAATKAANAGAALAMAPPVVSPPEPGPSAPVA